MTLNWKSQATRTRFQEAIFTLTNPYFPDMKWIDDWLDDRHLFRLTGRAGRLQDRCYTVFGLAGCGQAYSKGCKA